MQILGSDLERSDSLANTLILFCRWVAAKEGQLRSFEKYKVSLLEIFIQLFWMGLTYCNYKKIPCGAPVQPGLENYYRIP